MRRVIVKSQNLAEVGWDPTTKTLDVVFKNAPGWVYTYQQVGMVKFVRILTAESIGGYFERNIRSKPRFHPFTKRKVSGVQQDNDPSL